MEEAQEIEESEEEELGTDDPGGSSFGPRKARLAKHLAEVDARTADLAALGPAELKDALQEIRAGTRSSLPEVLVRISAKAHVARDHRLRDDAFSALLKAAVRSVAAQAWGVTEAEREEEVQEVFLELFEQIRSGKAAMAGRVFSGWARRRAVSHYRKREARFEGAFDRIEPVHDRSDPIDEIAERIPSHEARIMLERKIRALPENLRTAFIRVHVLGFTREEVAAQMNTSVRTLYEWLKKAAEVLGQDGEDDEH